MPKTLMVFAVLALWDCGSEEEAVTPPIANVQGEVVVAQAPSVGAAHGGTLVQVGQHPVEVVANSGGEVRAYVRSDEPPPPDRVRMTVRVPDARGQRHPVMLVWNPSQNAYVGRARRVQIAPGAIDVQMAYGGETYEAEAPSYVIVQAPRQQVEVVEVDEQPQVVVQQPSRPTVVVERPQPTIVVERPSRPTIVVERPQPTIVVERPRPTIIVERPRPQVVVVQPARPGVIVVGGGHGKFKHRGRGHGHGHGRHGH